MCGSDSGSMVVGRALRSRIEGRIPYEELDKLRFPAGTMQCCSVLGFSKVSSRDLGLIYCSGDSSSALYLYPNYLVPAMHPNQGVKP